MTTDDIPSAMRGIVACETLYDEIERLAPEAEVRYLPHDLHEFPVNVGDDRRTRTYISEAIADLEDRGVTDIVIAFAGRTGLAGLRTEAAGVAVSLADECVSTFRYDQVSPETGEVKEPGTYYLTRGLIDRAVDGFKLSKAYQGEVEDLVDRFVGAADSDPGLRIDWMDSHLYERAMETGGGMTADSIDRFFADVLGFYDRVVLVDTGSLQPLHHWYAEAFASYLSGLGDGNEDVEVVVEEGDLGLLRALLQGTELPCDSPYVDCFQPGERLEW